MRLLTSRWKLILIQTQLGTTYRRDIAISRRVAYENTSLVKGVYGITANLARGLLLYLSDLIHRVGRALHQWQLLYLQSFASLSCYPKRGKWLKIATGKQRNKLIVILNQLTRWYVSRIFRSVTSCRRRR